MRYTDWVIDITSYTGGDNFCFVPVENPDSESPTFVTGLTIIASLKDFSRGSIRGVMHCEGQEACDKWIDQNKELYNKIMEEASAA